MILLNRIFLNIFFAADCIAISSLFGVPVSAQQTGINSSEIEIIENGMSGITIIYTPNIELKTRTVKMSTNTSFNLYRGTHSALPGEPIIPVRQVLIAVPEGSNPVVSLSESDFSTHDNVTAENAPGTALSDSVFRQNKWLNGEVYTTGETGYFRLQRVLPVTIYPVQYNPVQHVARTARRIVTHINFNADAQLSRNVLSRAVDTKSENLYNNLILNYESSKNWRKQPETQSLQKSGQFIDGLLFTVTISDEGVYKITYNDLVSAGLTPETIDSRSIKVYNNGGRQLPEDITEVRPNGLVENAIRVTGEEDGSFDQGDLILFYGRDTNGWEWTRFNEVRHYQSVYARENLYWISFGGAPGKRMQTEPLSQSTTQLQTSGRALVYREDEREKIHNSGNDWFMNIMLGGDSREFITVLSGYKIGSDTQTRILVTLPAFASGSSPHRVSASVNNSVPVTVSTIGFTDRVLRVTTPLSDNGINTLKVNYLSAPGSGKTLYLDWYEIDYERNLQPVEGVVKFYMPPDPGNNQEMLYRLIGYTNEQPDVYNITEFDDVRLHAVFYSAGDGSAQFSAAQGAELQQFYTVDSDHYREVPALKPRTYRDIKISNIAADMIIVSPREFESAAQPLKESRESRDNIRTEIVTIEDIYDNFSGGLQDPIALRDFVKFAFENWTDELNTPPTYLLLFGDGNYDYLGVRSTSAPVYVPPYQLNSIFDLTTRTLDDFFVRVSGNDNIVDLAVGRLPVQSVDMAQGVVNKLITYQENPTFGPWRNRIGFAADDEITPTSDFENIHTEQLEFVATADYIPDYLEQRKIYLMEFPTVSDVTSSSVRKPGAQDAMVSLMNEGALILNYVGHGNERLLAHEWLLNREIDMERIDNGRKQFFFYLSSCTFGRWDIPNEDSMGELLVTEPDRGAIALVSAARDVFAGPNHALMDAFYRNFLNGTRKTEPIGLAFMQAKIEENQPNSEKYHLLGDPSMFLEFPDNFVSISSITPDSLQALAGVRVNGSIQSQASFEGTAFLSVFDAEKTKEHIMNNGNIVQYKLPGSSIFRGNTTIDASSGNQFSMEFIVPKDITYGGKNGRVSLYLWDGETDGSVVVENLNVGGTQLGVVDVKGPEIEVLFDGRRFISGDIVQPKPELELRLSDPHGINITGEVGHKIELAVDDNQSTVDLSTFFEYDNGSFSTGSAVRALPGLTPGEHLISVRAWDNFNNSSTFKGIVQVIAENELTVQDVYNYPNPFVSETQFTFQTNAAADAEVEVKIFTVAGRLVKSLSYYHSGGSSFFVSPPWDGTDDDGDQLANGTYLYKLITRSNEGGSFKQIEALSKLVIMR